MSESDELQELDSGLTSGFWARVKAHHEREWGPAGAPYQEAVKRAITGPIGSEAEAVQRLKVVAAVQDALRRFLQWPEDRVAQIRASVDRQREGGGPSRRGPGL